MSKVGIFLCAVLFASAANASAISEVEEQFKATEQKMVQAIQTFYTGQFSLLTEIMTDVQQTVEKVNVEIQKLVNAAGNVDTSECVKLSNAVRDSGSDAIEATTRCIAEKLGPGNELIDEMQKIAAEVRAEIPEIKKQAENCGDNVTLCVEADIKAVRISATVIPDLNQKAEKVNSFWNTLSPSLADCRTTYGVTNFHEVSSTIVEKVQKCIQQL